MLRRWKLIPAVILCIFIGAASVKARAAEIVVRDPQGEELSAESGTESTFAEAAADIQEEEAADVPTEPQGGVEEPVAGSEDVADPEEESEFPIDDSQIPEDVPEEEKVQDRLHFITLNNEGDASDAILVESNGLYGLIDASHPTQALDGLPDSAQFIGTGANGQTVVHYLQELGQVDHLSFVLATHSHSDHIGGIPDIAASGMVNHETVYMYKPYEAVEESSEFRKWYTEEYAAKALQSMQDAGAVLLDLTAPSQEILDRLGAVIIRDQEDPVGDHIVFPFGDFRVALYNLHTESTDNENLNSVITTVTKGDERAVLMADMEMTDGMEERVVKAVARNEASERTDLYKAGHHGHNTSNGVVAISTLNPKNTVVCTNRTAPEPELLTYYNYLLEITGGIIYRTSEAEKGIIADFGENEVSILQMKQDGGTGDAAPWVTMYKTGWNEVYPDQESRAARSAKWLYVDSAGRVAKGWFKVENDWYLSDSSLIMQTGWQQVSGKWYYLENRGAMQTGWKKLNDYWYHMDTSGAMQTGWQYIAKNWFLFNGSGVMQTGWKSIGNKEYYFGGADSGVMQTYWLPLDGRYYYFGSSGALENRTGWQKISDKWYCLNEDRTARTGWQKIGNIWYYMNMSGAMQTGWQKLAGVWYYMDPGGAMQTGWQYIAKNWYLFNGSGAMQTGWQSIGNKEYYFGGADSGVMQTYWLPLDGKYYYFGSSGALEARNGWQLIGGKWHLLAEDRTALTGWQKSAGTWYFMDGAGIMKTGWLLDNGSWYYMNGSGAMQTGLAKIGANTYYLGENGVMRTGYVTIEGIVYYFDEGGAMQNPPAQQEAEQTAA